MGRLLECVELYGKLFNKSEIWCMLRGSIAATSLKMLLKNLYSVKCYDKLNMNVLTLSLWENFWWGLIYFDQFILLFFNLWQGTFNMEGSKCNNHL